MAPRFTYPDPRIDAVRGCVAVERGPLVLALESVDVAEVESVDELRVDVSPPPRTVDGRVFVRCRRLATGDPEWPYRSSWEESPAAGHATIADMPLVAYHAWANRGPSTTHVFGSRPTAAGRHVVDL